MVFQGERRRASAAAMGAAEPGTITGRAIVIGLLRQAGQDPDAVFGAGGYAPSARPPGEQGADWADLPPEVQADLQPWMFDRLARDHPDQAGVIGAALRDRAPVFIRANLARTTRAALAEALGSEFGVVPHPHCATALEITVNARRLTQHAAWRDGLFELQDAASQMAVASISDVVGGDAVAGDLAGMRVLDYCAGGGGKALALAAQGAQVTAHDADPARMADIAPRAARAKAQIKTVTAPKGTFDLVVVDAPCSGSGTWRRAPGPKWTLTATDLLDYQALQRDILEAAWTHVRPGGTLAYMTCSV
ncbi:MAG: RsmB/NOP family class I SAM-dependent RNA methyltransferase, partial [Pseudomonadota bacterium]